MTNKVVQHVTRISIKHLTYDIIISWFQAFVILTFCILNLRTQDILYCLAIVCWQYLCYCLAIDSRQYLCYCLAIDSWQYLCYCLAVDSWAPLRLVIIPSDIRISARKRMLLLLGGQIRTDIRFLWSSNWYHVRGSKN